MGRGRVRKTSGEVMVVPRIGKEKGGGNHSREGADEGQQGLGFLGVYGKWAQCSAFWPSSS